MVSEFATSIARELNIQRKFVANTLKLLEDGATIPFISRYRKEATGGMDEVGVYNIRQRYEMLEALEKRRAFILSSIKEAGKLTPDLRKRIEEATDITVLEDIYIPYKPKRRTRAQMAIELGLEPLARIIMAQNIENPASAAHKFVTDAVADEESAIAGACDIIAEWMSESEKARSIVRSRYQRNGMLVSKVVKGKQEDGINYENYFDYQIPLRTVNSHRLLAMLRGQAEGYLRLSVNIDDNEMIDRLSRLFVKSGASTAAAELVKNTVRDSYRRLIRPSIEGEIMAAAKAKADEGAIATFADNVRQLLLAPPLGRHRVMAVDPGYRTGCKVVCLDESGNLLCHDVIYPNPPQNDYHGSAFKISRMVDGYHIDAIGVGNGTAGRETEKFLGSLRFPRQVDIYTVNENGASVYSASQVAREEFPDYDVTVRGAVSIGRRLLDPLAELVKIDPKSIGVGQYQHDVDQVKLKDALDFTVESCVNSVGVNVNTASRQLLSYVSGIGPALAGYIVDYRLKNGHFRSRRQLMEVPRMGEKAFQQCAGFLRIPDGESVLDNTAVHPERYELVERIARDNKCTIGALVANPDKMATFDYTPYIDKEVGLPTISDIIEELKKPGRDPRSTAEPVHFDEGVRDIKDLHPGMILSGVVNNITDFGCFVDIGLHENGLVHLSQMADRFVRNPSEVVSLHQTVTVRVIDVDYVRKRIALSLKDVPQG